MNRLSDKALMNLVVCGAWALGVVFGRYALAPPAVQVQGRPAVSVSVTVTKPQELPETMKQAVLPALERLGVNSRP